MARDTMAFTRMAGRRMVDPAGLAAVRMDAPIQPLDARPVAEVAAAPSILAREAMLFRLHGWRKRASPIRSCSSGRASCGCGRG